MASRATIALNNSIYIHSVPLSTNETNEPDRCATDSSSERSAVSYRPELTFLSYLRSQVVLGGRSFVEPVLKVISRQFDPCQSRAPSGIEHVYRSLCKGVASALHISFSAARGN